MPVIGIDLGTSNTCVAVVHNGQPQVILDEKGRATLPSVMSLNRKDQFYVGYMAKAQMAVQPERTIHSANDYSVNDSIRKASNTSCHRSPMPPFPPKTA